MTDQEFAMFIKTKTCIVRSFETLIFKNFKMIIQLDWKC